MQKIQHYVLFPNHDNGMRLYGILKEAGIKTTIAPTPRVASKCIDENQIEILKIAAIERDINPKRDKYC